MELNYKGRDFELVQLVDLNGEEFYNIVAIYEVIYVYFLEGGQVKEVGVEEWQRAYENNEDLPFQDFKFVNYFWGADDDIEVIKENAKNFIDDYDKKEGKIAQLLRGLENYLRGLDLPKRFDLLDTLESNEPTQEYLLDIMETLLERITKDEEK